MQDFSYKRDSESSTMILEKIKKKISTEQKIFFTIFILIILLLTLYFGYKFFIKNFDGYVSSKNYEIRLIDDVSIVEIHVRQGDKVAKGDTLFWYILTNAVYDVVNPSNITNVEQERKSSELKVRDIEAQIKMFSRKYDSLNAVIKKEQEEVAIGIRTQNEIDDKKWQLFNIKEQIEYNKQILETNKYYLDKMEKYSDFAPELPSVSTLENLKKHKKKYGNTLKPWLANEDMLIVSINAMEGSYIYKKEAFMQVYTYKNPKLADLHVLALIPPKDFAEIEHGEKVEIYSGNEKICDGTINLSATKMYEVDPSKLGVLSLAKESIGVRVDLDSPKDIDIKYQVEKLPIKVVYHRDRLRWIKQRIDNIWGKMLSK